MIKIPTAKLSQVSHLAVPEVFNFVQDAISKMISQGIFQWIEELVKGQGGRAIKLDCFTQNPYSQKMYEKLGYKTVGYADWRKGRFALMEKVL